MGISSSKTKTKSTPYAPAVGAINAGLTSSQDVFNQNQPILAKNAGMAQDAFQQLSNSGAFQTSPYVANAQQDATAISNGAFLNNNPGAGTYANIQNSTNPSLGALTGLANNPQQNPALASLSGLANGQGNNPATGLLSAFANGGGAGSDVLNSIAGGSYSNPSDAYSSSVTGGKYLNNQPSQGVYDNLLSSDYLKGNPYIDQIVAQTNADASKAVNQRFASAGQSMGVSSALGDVLSNNLAKNENTLRYNNYNDASNRQLAAAGQSDSVWSGERNRMQDSNSLISSNYNTGQANRLSAANSLASNSLGAAGQLGSQFNQGQSNQISAAGTLGSLFNQGQQNQAAAANSLGSQFNQQQQTQLAAGTQADASRNASIQQILASLGLTGQLSDAQYAGVDPALNVLQTASTIPYVGLNAYANAINGLAGDYGTKTTTATPSTFDQIKNGVKTAAQVGAAFSDRRLKTDVARVGEASDGLGIYTYRYTFGGPSQMGVMADEVAKLRPEALGPVVEGYATVDYSKLGAF